jgi:hypothetical protein
MQTIQLLSHLQTHTVLPRLLAHSSFILGAASPNRTSAARDNGVARLWRTRSLSSWAFGALYLLSMLEAGCERKAASLHPTTSPPPSSETGWVMIMAAVAVVALVLLPFLYTLWTGQGKNEPVMHSPRRRRTIIMIASAVMATVIVLMVWIFIRA